MTTTTPAQSLPGRTLKSGIEAGLIQLLASPINPDRSNSGKMLWNVYFWQVVADLAEARCKSSWEAIQGTGGLVGKDDELRDLTVGEHIAAESSKFTALVTVTKPRRNLDRAKLVSELARKFRVPAKKIEAIIEKCKVAGTAPLSKRVVEAEG